MLSSSQEQQIFSLWNAEYPASICHSNINNLRHYLSKLENPKHLFIFDNEAVVAWYCDFDRNQERNFAMIVSRQAQGRGIGTQLLDEAKANNNMLCGWVVKGNGYQKLDGSNYDSPLAFYQKNGFEILHDQIWETDVLKTVKIRWCKSLKS
ncbi:MAG: GNAT family N-acetyltransferase [Bacteroidia bacterium]